MFQLWTLIKGDFASYFIALILKSSTNMLQQYLSEIRLVFILLEKYDSSIC